MSLPKAYFGLPFLVLGLYSGFLIVNTSDPLLAISLLTPTFHPYAYTAVVYGLFAFMLSLRWGWKTLPLFGLLWSYTEFEFNALYDLRYPVATAPFNQGHWVSYFILMVVFFVGSSAILIRYVRFKFHPVLVIYVLYFEIWWLLGAPIANDYAIGKFIPSNAWIELVHGLLIFACFWFCLTPEDPARRGHPGDRLQVKPLRKGAGDVPSAAQDGVGLDGAGPDVSLPIQQKTLSPLDVHLQEVVRNEQVRQSEPPGDYVREPVPLEHPGLHGVGLDAYDRRRSMLHEPCGCLSAPRPHVQDRP